MGHVEHVDISDFKCLKSVSLDCAQFNILTGRNGTGKSSVLEAIEVAHQPKALKRYDKNVSRIIRHGEESSTTKIKKEDRDMEISISKATGDQASGIIKNIFLESLFIIGKEDGSQYISPVGDVVDKQRIIKQMNLDEETSMSSEFSHRMVSISQGGVEFGYGWPVSGSQESIEKIRSIVEKSLEKDLDKLNEYEILTADDHSRGIFLNGDPDDRPIRYIFPADTQNNLEEDDAVNLVRVRDFLREHGIFPNLESFSFDEIVFEEDGDQYAVPYDFLGEGTKTIVKLVWELVSEEEIPDVVMIEEPETHLHPGYVKELVTFLIKFAREEDVQLFLTTHNVDFIKEFFNKTTIGDHSDWLAEEFRLIQMTGMSPKQLDYERAQNHFEELHLDLRGS